MNPAYKVVLFVLCFTAITTINIVNGGMVGNCRDLSAEEFQEDQDVQDGYEKLRSKLAAGVNCNPGYKAEVDLTDVKACTQVVAGKMYRYRWTKEQARCVSDPNSGINNEPYDLPEKNVNCKANYWVKRWQSFYDLSDAKCS